MGGLGLIHAVNDYDISAHQTEMICRRMFGGDADAKAQRCVDVSKGASVLTVNEAGRVGVRFEILEHGGKCSYRHVLIWEWPCANIKTTLLTR